VNVATRFNGECAVHNNTCSSFEPGLVAGTYTSAHLTVTGKVGPCDLAIAGSHAFSYMPHAIGLMQLNFVDQDERRATTPDTTFSYPKLVLNLPTLIILESAMVMATV
jgi:hypothetical protein